MPDPRVTRRGLTASRQGDTSRAAVKGQIGPFNASSSYLLELTAGGIRLTNVSGALSAATAVGNIFARLANGRRLSDSSLATSSGDITVLIPSSLALTIRAENGRSGGARAIVSDFPAIVVRGEGPLAVAEGRLNGGGPVLKLSGMGGTIFIKRQE